jgi:hypothetical protein
MSSSELIVMTDEALGLWGFIYPGYANLDAVPVGPTINSSGPYITRTTALPLYQPEERRFRTGYGWVHDMQIDVAGATPLHLTLDHKLVLAGMRLVHPTYLPPGRNRVRLILDVVGADVTVARGQRLVVCDTRAAPITFSIGDGRLYKD